MFASIGWPIIDRVPLVGDLAVSPHGIFIAVGFLFGAWWLLREGPKRGIAIDHINNAILIALVGAVLGARIFYVIGHFSEFESVGEMIALWNGGLTLLGGIAGAILLNIPYLRKKGYRFFQGMDSAAIGMAFGLAVGRIGDLIIGDHLGKPTNAFLAFVYKGGQLAGFACEPLQGPEATCFSPLADGQSITISEAGAVLARGNEVVSTGIGVHQTALYDLIGASLLFLLLYWMNRRHHREGVLFCVFLLWYGIERIVTDFMRIDKTIFGMTGSQWTALIAALVAFILLIKWKIDEKRFGPMDPRPSTAFVPPLEPQRSR